MPGKITLLDYANDREYVVVNWRSVGTPMGSSTPLGYPDLDFADRNGLLELSGDVDEGGVWEWDGEGRPTDDLRNSILQIEAGPSKHRWEKIIAEYESEG
jgi:hypothetical protein